MSKPTNDFMSLVMKGDEILDAIDDYVEAWHQSTSDIQLHEFLGMTTEEYDFYCENPTQLKLVVSSREDKIPLNQLVESVKDEYALSARGKLSGNKAKILEWLKRTKRI
jgi:hypothetical protein